MKTRKDQIIQQALKHGNNSKPDERFPELRQKIPSINQRMQQESKPKN
jgi:hypothetical protein